MDLKFCTNCVMDGSDPNLVLDEKGICNHCHSAQKQLRAIDLEKKDLPEVIAKIKKDGEGKEYDCVVGLSGGVDSSATLVAAVKQFGLRPLCFTMDNGYNDPRADENILRLVESLKVRLYRYVLNIGKFKSLQAAFLRAGLVNVEIPTDHVLMAASFEIANLYNIKYILSGGNVVTESIMPHAWSYPAKDLRHIKSVYKWATGKKLTDLPTCGLFKWNVYRWLRGVRTIYLLDYLDYNRLESEAMLIRDYGFQSTGEKHEESVFTRWFQSFYLFQKFGIDKRKAHYSSLINAGLMTRSEALAKLAEQPVYPEFKIEKKVMGYPKKSHYDFKTDERLFNFISKVVRTLKKL